MKWTLPLPRPAMLAALALLLMPTCSQAANLGSYDEVVKGLQEYHFVMLPAPPGKKDYLTNAQRMMGRTREGKLDADLELIGKDLKQSVDRAILDVPAVQDIDLASLYLELMNDYVTLMLPGFKDVDERLGPLLNTANRKGSVLVKTGDREMLISFNRMTGSFSLSVKPLVQHAAASGTEK